MDRPGGEADGPDGKGLLRPYPGPAGATVEFWQWLAALTDEDWLTLDEAAAMARMPEQTFRYVRTHNHDGPRGVRMGKRVMFAKGDVREWLQTRRAGAA